MSGGSRGPSLGGASFVVGFGGISPLPSGLPAMNSWTKSFAASRRVPALKTLVPNVPPPVGLTLPPVGLMPPGLIPPAGFDPLGPVAGPPTGGFVPPGGLGPAPGGFAPVVGLVPVVPDDTPDPPFSGVPVSLGLPPLPCPASEAPISPAVGGLGSVGAFVPIPSTKVLSSRLLTSRTTGWGGLRGGAGVYHFTGRVNERRG